MATKRRGFVVPASASSFASSVSEATKRDVPPPSIFNDVLGPVMRGPSSSHSAAALRIGRIVKMLLEDGLSHHPHSTAGGDTAGATLQEKNATAEGTTRPPRVKLLVEYDPNGSLVTTHDGQGSDMGLLGGLMGWEADDSRLTNFKEEAAKAGLEMEVRYLSYGAQHPNTYRMTATSDNGSRVEATAISTGGGIIEFLQVDGFPVTFRGDREELLVWMEERPECEEKKENRKRNDKHAEEEGKVSDFIERALEESNRKNIDTFATVYEMEGNTAAPSGSKKLLLQVSSSSETVIKSILEKLRCDHRDRSSASSSNGSSSSSSSSSSNILIKKVAAIRPVLPVKDPGRQGRLVPFLNVAEMEQYAEDHDNMPLWQLGARYESARGNMSEDEVLDAMLRTASIMRGSVEEGLAGTSYSDRILPCQSSSLARAMNQGQVIPGDVLNKVILYVTAIMEVKSSMGVIVAAPTAGSCGACPGTILAVAEQLGKDEVEVARALLVAGIVGVMIAKHATFAAEMGGCMAECGAGSGMAAAAITTMAGGDTKQALGAASLALQNSFGMTCDPIANRVEAPCLGKNVMAATNSISCSNMAMAGYRHLIPLDEVLVAMKAVGEQLPHELRCTGKGGISATPTARAIEAKLKNNDNGSNGDDRGARPTPGGSKIQC